LGGRSLRGIHRPASIIKRLTVSFESVSPWHSRSFSQAKVGPKSA
jgi:hypothetical protein